MAESNNQKNKGDLKHRILTIIGTILCVILLPILITNVTLIVKSLVEPDKVPSVAGILPLIVMTDSMYPEIESGDIIICHTEEPENVKSGDIVAFFDPAGNGISVVTHRVVELVEDQNGLSFRTKGDANNTEDAALVPAENLVGVYRTRVPGVGHVAMFMQTTAGLIVCVILPLVLMVGYDMLRRRQYEKKNQQDTDALLAELQALKAEKAAREQEKLEL